MSQLFYQFEEREMAYSLDFREKILEAYLNKEGTNRGLSERFKISESTVKRISQRYRETGKVELYLNKIGHGSKVDEASQQILKELVTEEPDATLKVLQKKLKNRCQVEVTIPTIHYLLKKPDISYKKKSVYAIERDSDGVKKKERYLKKRC